MTYGPIDVARWMAHKRETNEFLHVFLNGEEITTQCIFADDEAGYVTVLLRDAEGRRYLDPETQMPAREDRRGRVEILPEPNYPHD